MGNHGKKMIAPIVVTVLMVRVSRRIQHCRIHIYCHLHGSGSVFGGVPLICAGVMIAVCIQRMKEIRSGEEDDLSKYWITFRERS